MTRAAYTARADTAEQLAPTKPPCFETRARWVEWVRSAAQFLAAPPAEQVLILGGARPVFNTAVNFCVDCNPGYAAEKAAGGLCQPRALRTPAPEKETA